MEKIIINENSLGEPIKTKTNTESSLYLRIPNIYKILKKGIRLADRQIVIHELNIKKPEGVCNPNGIIFNEKQEFIGYSMPYLEEYTNLDISNLSYETRIEYVKKINQIFRRLLKLGLYYQDLHFDNFMVKDDDVILVDSDSAIQICKKNYKFEQLYLRCCCERLSRLSLSLILKLDIDELNHKFGKKNMKKQLLEIDDEAIREIILFTYNNRKFSYLLYADDLVDLINKDKIFKIDSIKI